MTKSMTVPHQSGKSGRIRESNKALGVRILGALRVVLCTKKLYFISWNWRKENSTVASGSSSIKIHYFVYFKRFINRINEVCVCVFSMKKT